MESTFFRGVLINGYTGLSEIGMEELLLQKRCHKTNFYVSAQLKKFIALEQLKKTIGRTDARISSKYLINTLIAEW